MDKFTLDGYERLNILQVGQTSEVWEVLDTKTRQRFVMKLLLPEKVDAKDQRQFIKHEADVGMKLIHKNIIKILKFNANKGNPYMLMEVFPATNLKLRLMRGEFKTFVRPRLRSTLEQVASAIGHMHDKGWVHRDIKPDNVLVNNVGEVRLIDFALAQKVATGLSRWLHRKGSTAGTRSYMSPEQIKSEPLDGRADIYSFGCMLFEMIQGKLPFIANSANDLLRKHLNDPAPMVKLDTKITPEFQQLILKMLSKKPDQRPQSMQEFLQAIRSMKLFTDEDEAKEADESVSPPTAVATSPAADEESATAVPSAAADSTDDDDLDIAIS